MVSILKKFTQLTIINFIFIPVPLIVFYNNLVKPRSIFADNLT